MKLETGFTKIKLSLTLAPTLLVSLALNHAGAQPPPGAGVANNPERRDPATAIKDIQLPAGFKIDIYASDIQNPRSLALSPNGTLFVGSRTAGNVYAVVDSNNDFKADAIHTIATNLRTPNGVAFRDGSLYVAEISRLLRYDDIESQLKDPPEAVVLDHKFPQETHHGWKYINFGPDGKLYVPVGAPCNICEPSDKHGLIARINPDGSGYEVFARGIRNTVGFDWHPQTGDLWFTDNGRDLWGDNRPPEELNRAAEAGLHFGYPYRYGKALVDDEFSTEMKDSAFTPAAWEFPAHNAGLGVQFYAGNSFPEDYRNDMLIAFHGSWNRSKPDGYRIMRAELENNEVVNTEVFASGWLQGEKYRGRPVDLELLPDGSVLVSDDFANVIYRISYQP